MTEATGEKTPSLAERWSLEQNEHQPAQIVISNRSDPTSEDATGKPDETSSVEKIDEKLFVEETLEKKDKDPTADESAETPEDEPEVVEEQPEIKIQTAPADFRFPTTNQTRHCFTRYIEYHRCVQAKGEEAEECNKFAKYYRSLCPNEWVERWNEQRENGTFPGPL